MKSCATVISICLTSCSSQKEDTQRQILSFWTMNQVSQISPQWAYLLRRNAVLARKPQPNPTSLREPDRGNDLCFRQICADSVLTGRKCTVHTVNSEASHIWFNQPLYTVMPFENILLFTIPNQWMMNIMPHWCGYSAYCDVKLHHCLIRCLLEIQVKIHFPLWLLLVVG